MNSTDQDNRIRAFEIERTTEFDDWFDNLKNIQARAVIQARISRIEYDGFFGDTKGVGDNVSELRFHFGAGWCWLQSVLYYSWQQGSFYAIWWRQKQ